MRSVNIVWFGAALLYCLMRTAGAGKVTWNFIPPALTRIQGQNMTLTWTVNVSTTILLIQLKKDGKDIYFHNVIDDKYRYPQGDHVSRSADLNLTTSQSGSVWDIKFVMLKLSKKTDEGEYKVSLAIDGNHVEGPRTTRLTINVPPVITNKHPYTISTNETKTVQLVCNATGFPTPAINWTRNGVVVGTGSPFSLVTKPEDHNQCYTCVASNGVYDAQKANVCLIVQYQYNWTTLPPASLTKLYGESMRLNWFADLSSTAFESVTVWRTTNGIRSKLITQYRNGSVIIIDKGLQNRSSEIIMRSTYSGSQVNITFEIRYVIKSFDEAIYDVSVTGLSGNTDVVPSKTQLNINDSVVWTQIPSPLSKLHGESILLNWIVRKAERKIVSVAVSKTKDNSRTQVIIYSAANNNATAQGLYGSRASEVFLDVTTLRSIVKISFRLLNLQLTDNAQYDASVTFESNITNTVPSKTQVIVDANLVWVKIPTDLTRIQDQSMKLVWIINAPHSLLSAKIWRKLNHTHGHQDVVYYIVGKDNHTALGPYVNRSHHLNLTATHKGSVMTFTFTLTNIVKSDEGQYDITVTTSNDIVTAPKLTKLTVNVPPVITSKHPYFISTNETKTVQLVCNATGFPTPTINWTRNGVVVGTGSPFSLVAKPEDHNQCYTCVASNGVYDAQKANVCLTVQYKPRNATLTVDRSTVCQNDNVTLTCTSGPSNPAPSGYKFYYNGALIHSSSSNVFSANSTQSHVNRFICVPGNLLGDALINASTDVRAKVPPSVTQKSNDTVVLEGSNLTLTCNVSGELPLNVTWTKSGQHLSYGNVYRINNIKRKDGGVYRCTVTNGNECPSASNTINVTIKHSPIILNGMSLVPVNLGTDARLMCNVIGFPQTNINWTRNGVLIHSGNPYIKKNVSKSDEGRCFTCVAFNDVGVQSANICLTVNYKPESVQATVTPRGGKLCKPNSTVRMTCNATAKPPPEYLWYLNNQLVQRNMDGIFSTRLNKTGHNTLVCVPNNTVGLGIQNQSVPFTVKDPPLITVTPQNVVLLQGQKLQFFCNASGSPSLGYEWFKVGSSSPVGNTETFTISNILIKDEGTYQCKVKNGPTCTVASILHNVTVNAPANITNPQRQTPTFNEGEPASLVCESTGKPTPNINWTRNGATVHTGSPYSTPVLTYNDNNACYTCVAYNGIGDAKTAEVCLNVQYKPRNATLTVDRSTVCQNDNVTLTCTSGPSNPAPSGYKFYYNGVLVQNSSTNAYRTKVIHVLTAKNVFICVPYNLLGDAITNAVINVTAKDPPSIAVSPRDVTRVEGQSLTLFCNASGHPAPNITWYKGGRIVGRGESFIVNNVSRGDEGSYRCVVNNGKECDTDSAVANVTVNVPVKITTSNPKRITINEGQRARLVCEATGKPTPNITWTRNGLTVHTGSPYNTPVLTYNDNNACYTCVAYNGVGNTTETAQFCLNVQYKPRNATIKVDRSIICKDDNVTMRCTSGPSNPAPSSYKIYHNNIAVHTSPNNVYTTQLLYGLPHISRFTCVPSNLIGDAVENATTAVSAKVPPAIIQRTAHLVVVEGSELILWCNVSGTPLPNVTWTSASGQQLHFGRKYQVARIKREAEGVYQCTASNGNECPAAKDTINVTVNYKPESTTFTKSSSQRRFCRTNSTTFTCSSTAKPPAEYSLYRNNQLVQSRSRNGIFVVQLNDKGENNFTCVPNNTVAEGERKTISIFVSEPPTITQRTAHLVVVEGSELILWCNVSGTPLPNVTWTSASGQQLHFGRKYQVSKIKREAEGVYHCTASNGNECPSTKDTINVTVNYKPESTTFTKSSSQSRFCKTNSTTFTCSSTAKPPAEYSLYRNNQLVQSRSSNGSFVVQLNDKGENNFTCVPNNTVGEGERKTISLFVTDPPAIVIPPRDIAIVEGQRLTLFCNASGHPAPNITWYKVGGSIVGRGNRYIINNIKRRDEGSYQCVVDGLECNTVQSQAKVTVNYPSLLLRSPRKYVTINFQESLNLTCEGEGEPQPSITWRRNDNTEIIGRNSTLKLSPAASLPGNYTCTLSNKIGSASHVTAVTVLACKDHKCDKGTCVALGSLYSCKCLQEYKGEHCDIHVCKGNLCKHGSTCYSTPTGYGCNCARGLTGTYCEKEDTLGRVFTVEMGISNREWKSEYKNLESQESKALKGMLCPKMNLTFNATLIDCEVVWFRPGSILTKLKLTFNKIMTESEVLAQITSQTDNNTFGELQLKPSPIIVMHYENPCSKEPCKFDGECQTKNDGFICKCNHFRYGENCENGVGLVSGIILMVVIILILLFAIFLLMAYFRQKETSQDNVDGFQNGIKMKTLKYNNAEYMYARSNVVFYGDHLDEQTYNEEKHVNGRTTFNALDSNSTVLWYQV